MSTNQAMIFLDVNGVKQLLGVGRNNAYRILSLPDLSVIRIGRQIRVRQDVLLDYLATHPNITLK